MWIVRKHKTRELAMQVLFLWDAHGEAEPNMARQLAADWSDDAEIRADGLEIARSAWELREAADRWVERVAPDWPPQRQPQVDRSILRLAVWEMINTPTDPPVVIDEAIKLARFYSTEQGASFINGVLDAILKEHRALTAAASPGGATTTDTTAPPNS